jgi:hypothetical protein
MKMDDRPIHYEPHPVSQQRKAELLKQGVRILDAKFAPPGWNAPTGLTPTGVVLTEADALADLKGEPRPDNPGRSSWAENEPPAERAGEDMETDDLKALLDARGIRYRSNASRATLFALLRGE